MIRKEAQSLGYVRVDLPIAIAKRAAALSAIDAVDLDEVLSLGDPAPQGTDHRRHQ